MVTTIIFDLSEVYLHGMKGVEKRIEITLGVDVPNKIYVEKEADQFFNGEITEEKFWQKVIDRNHWNIDIATLKRLIRENMTEIEGTREIIETLKRNGYILGLLSVHGKEWIKHCEKQFEYHKLFHSVMYSFEVGVSKPELKAFQLMLEKLKVNSTECLLIDDSLNNIEAARKLGMQTLLFEDAEQLRTALKQFHVKL